MEVAFPLAVSPLWYRVPGPLEERVRPGAIVLCPLKGRRRWGVVVGLKGDPPEGIPEFEEVEAVAGWEPLSRGVLELLKFSSSHYVAPLGMALKAALPSLKEDPLMGVTEKGVEALKGGTSGLLSALGRRPLRLKTLERRFGKEEVQRGLREGFIGPAEPRGKAPSVELSEVGCYPRPDTLSPWQQRALREIRRKDGPFLLFGVTGSGKTEVYLRTAEEALEKGKGVLFLVPEIALTPQLYTRVKERLGGDVAVLHSAMTPSERREGLRRVLKGEVKVVLGARSAVFSPIRDLGLIVVDEEHDSSYKQDEGRLKYNARDLALVRGRVEGAKVLLGSATPSVESFYNALRGKYTLLEMPFRIGGKKGPRAEVLDLRGRKGIISPELLEALRWCVSKGGQAILFLNRRGYAPFMACGECGEALRCKNCSVSLTYHASAQILLCHYCGYVLKAPQVCPGCGGRALRPFGFGTERVTEEVRRLIPGARVERMDSDAVSARRDYERILKGLESGEIDVLVGTQMVVKGHDFPRIRLVGVVLADTGLNLPDFRAAEKTFQLLSQAAGRAGRGPEEGRVLIQTYLPDHYAILSASQGDYLRFFEEEIRLRKDLHYPPFCRMALVRFSGRDEGKVRDAAYGVAKDLEGGGCVVLGPAPAPIERLQGRWRWQLLLKAPRYLPLREALGGLKAQKGVKVEWDVDPLDML